MTEQFYDLRVFYEKTGRMRFISHLDMNRCMTRFLRQTGLPVWYTQGFHPHVYMNFALPLSLGFAAVRESFDFRLTKPLPPAHVAQVLNDVLPEGLQVSEVTAPVMKPTEIGFAVYECTMECENEKQAAERLTQFARFCEQTEISAEKPSKKGLQTINIRPLFTVKARSAQENRLMLHLQTAAGTTQNLNPQLVLQAFLPHSVWWVTRTEILTKQEQPFR